MAGTIFMIIIILLIVYIVTSCVRIVPQAQAYVIERLGAYNGTGPLECILKCHLLTVLQRKFS